MTEANETFDVPCDLCGSVAAEAIPHCGEYTGGQLIHVCSDCGFVHVKKRRSAREIADSWSNDIYGEGKQDHIGYTAHIPAVKARQIYVADTLAANLDVKGLTLCDIGGGEGQFLDIVRKPPYGADVFAIEPSDENCKALDKIGISNFSGTIEEFSEHPGSKSKLFDVVTIMWTLENCYSCVDMMNAAYNILKPGGRVLVATGSRVLVPFKKPLHMYLGSNPGDTHSFRFSANTLNGLLARTGFQPIYTNRYIDTDYLVSIGEKTDRAVPIPWNGDKPEEVLDFFERWHVETKSFYPAR